jgi:TonB family protein
MLRESAVVAPMPEYPRSSVMAETQGRVVVSVSYDSKGIPTIVTVMEAPDTATGAAVETAMRLWKFRPLTLKAQGGTASQTTGRLVFYFTTPQGHPTVTDAAAVVLASEQSRRQVGHWFAREGRKCS